MTKPIWNSGSEWHRWDPHIHVPGTLFNDQFKGDWNGFLDAIEKAAPVAEALGITDYCVLDGYKEFRKRWEGGRALLGGCGHERGGRYGRTAERFGLRCAPGRDQGNRAHHIVGASQRPRILAWPKGRLQSRRHREDVLGA